MCLGKRNSHHVLEEAIESTMDVGGLSCHTSTTYFYCRWRLCHAMMIVFRGVYSISDSIFFEVTPFCFVIFFLTAADFSLVLLWMRLCHWCRDEVLGMKVCYPLGTWLSLQQWRTWSLYLLARGHCRGRCSGFCACISKKVEQPLYFWCYQISHLDICP